MFNPFRKKPRETLSMEDANSERIVTKHTRGEDGGQLTYVSQEKYPIRGDTGKMGGALMALKPIKSILNKIVMGRLANLIPFDTQRANLTEPVREIARLFDLLIDAEKLEGNKDQWKAWKKLVCIMLENDVAYRYRFQWMAERLNNSKVRLTDGDKYFFRVKNFWVDLEAQEREAKKALGTDDLTEFKKWLSKEENWKHEDKDKYKDMAILAKEYLIWKK